jgi:hypothetical protein
VLNALVEGFPPVVDKPPVADPATADVPPDAVPAADDPPAAEIPPVLDTPPELVPPIVTRPPVADPATADAPPDGVPAADDPPVAAIPPDALAPALCMPPEETFPVRAALPLHARSTSGAHATGTLEPSKAENLPNFPTLVSHIVPCFSHEGRWNARAIAYCRRVSRVIGSSCSAIYTGARAPKVPS